MLPKQYRLTKDNDFAAVSRGRFFYASFLTIKFISNNLPFSRFGLIVSNKISKKATQRNLIKRRLRAIISLNLKTWPKGLDIVIIVGPKIINAQGKVLASKELEAAVLNLFKKANLI